MPQQLILTLDGDPFRILPAGASIADAERVILILSKRLKQEGFDRVKYGYSAVEVLDTEKLFREQDETQRN